MQNSLLTMFRFCRMTPLLCRVLTLFPIGLLAFTFAVLFTGLLPIRALATPVEEVQHITQAQWQFVANDVPTNEPSALEPWQTTSLPRQFQVPGQAWVKLRLPPRWAQAPALYLPAAGIGIRLILNGQPIDTLGDHPPALSRPFHTPRLIQLPALWWRSGQPNELLIHVQVREGFRSGVSDVYLGPPNALRPQWWRQAMAQEAATLITGLLGISLGLYVLLRWSRQHNLTEFAWFGLIFVIWGLRTLQNGLAQLPLPGDVTLVVRSLGSTWSVVLFILFALMLSRSEDPSYRAYRWLGQIFLAYGLIVSILVLLVPSTWIEGPQMRWAYALGLGLTLWGQWRIAALAVKLRRIELWVPAVLIVLYIGLAAISYASGPERFPFAEHLAHQYESAPLFLSAGWMLAHRYWRALKQARALTRSLQEQVDAQRLELQRNFEQLHEVEREKARTQERSRVMRDLHDGLGLHLVSALRQVNSGTIQFDTLLSTLQDGLDELRVAIDSLDTGQRDPLNLLGTLRYRLAPRFASLGVHLSWQVATELPELPELSPTNALQLLRIVQEALGNALKHSGATEVCIALSPSIIGCLVKVSDNGHGFDTARAPANRGLGHQQSRAKAMGANWSIISDVHGTIITLDVPLPPTTEV